MKTCRVDGCAKVPVARGLCDTHRKQEDRGRPLAAITAKVPARRISVRISKPTHAALGKKPSSKAREVLEAWADRKKGGKGP